MTSHPQPPHKPRHAHGERVVAALRTVFGNRLRSVVAYGPHVDDNRDGAFSCLALVTSVTVADLEACAARTNRSSASHRGPAPGDGRRAPQVTDGIVPDMLALERPSSLKATDAARLFPEYLAAVEQLARYVDTWNV